MGLNNAFGEHAAEFFVMARMLSPAKRLLGRCIDVGPGSGRGQFSRVHHSGTTDAKSAGGYRLAHSPWQAGDEGAAK